MRAKFGVGVDMRYESLTVLSDLLTVLYMALTGLYKLMTLLYVVLTVLTQVMRMRAKFGVGVNMRCESLT